MDIPGEVIDTILTGAGVAGAILLLVILASAKGWIEWMPTIALRKERQTAADKQIADLLQSAKDQTLAMNRMADGLERENKLAEERLNLERERKRKG